MAASRARSAGQRFVQQAVHPALTADDVRRLALRLEPWEVDQAWRHSTVMLRRATSPHHVAALVAARAALLDAIETTDADDFVGWMAKALRCGAHRGPTALS